MLVNLYFNAFGTDVGCLSAYNVTKAKREAMIGRLQALNHILRAGAEAASFPTAELDFDGHGVCSPEPYVQGVEASAPFHPTSAGELAIAFADDRALHTVR